MLEGCVLTGGFRVGPVLGTGGTAVVHGGQDAEGRPVAIKVMRSEMLDTPTVRERFMRERRIMDTVDHVGIVKVFADGKLDDGSVYIVMELLRGESLHDRMHRKGGYLAPPEVLAFADRILDILRASHAHGVLHRDIKPENVFLTDTSELKLLDFGIASAPDAEKYEPLTHAGYALGTPAFMAPEQARGEWGRVDARTDLWALGATMYYGLVGEPVHTQRATVSLELLAAASEKARPLAEVLPGVRAPLAALVDRALAFDPSDRFANADDMRDALARAWFALGSGPMTQVWERIARDIVVRERRESLAHPPPATKSERPDMDTVVDPRAIAPTSHVGIVASAPTHDSGVRAARTAEGLLDLRPADERHGESDDDDRNVMDSTEIAGLADMLAAYTPPGGRRSPKRSSPSGAVPALAPPPRDASRYAGLALVGLAMLSLVAVAIMLLLR